MIKSGLFIEQGLRTSESTSSTDMKASELSGGGAGGATCPLLKLLAAQRERADGCGGALPACCRLCTGRACLHSVFNIMYHARNKCARTGRLHNGQVDIVVISRNG